MGIQDEGEGRRAPAAPVVGVYPGGRRTGVAAICGAEVLAVHVLDRGCTPTDTGWAAADVKFALWLNHVVDDLAEHVSAETIAVGAPPDSGAAADVQRAAVLGALAALVDDTGRQLVRVAPGPYGEGASPAVFVCSRRAGLGRPSQFAARAAVDVARRASDDLGHRRWNPRVVKGVQGA